MKILKEREDEYRKWREKNKDPYGNACFIFAEDWANRMEERMEKGDSLEDVAKEKSYQASEAAGGITGFMYGAGVSILAFAWIHGEALRRWHNLKTQIGKEGEEANKKGGVLNPALMTIKI